jgi:hypothetical protein
MSRYSDVWIVLTLAAVAGWQNWEQIEPEISSTVAGALQFSSSAASALIETAEQAAEVQVTREPSSTVDTHHQPPIEPFDVRWRVDPFDCSHVPPGCVIVHELPSCGMPLPCRGY